MDTCCSKNEEVFLSCILCDYKCSKKYNFDRHVATDKHKRIHFGYILDTKNEQNEQNEQNKYFSCECGNKYKFSQGLSKHKKVCKFNFENKQITENSKKNDNKEEIINYLIKENKEFKNLIVEILKKDTITNNNNTISNNTINSNNKTFNLQFFLNETCKNAMNISEFVDSIKLQLSDLENVGKIGYVEGLSNIIIKSLNNMDITERPVHCSDSKRDTIYVKDENKWEKENEDHQKIIKAIEDIANKNTQLIKEWKKVNPECANSKSKKADQYSHILIEALCSNNDTNNQKVLKKISHEVIIDKSGIL
jgi:hypothetical protein